MRKVFFSSEAVIAGGFMKFFRHATLAAVCALSGWAATASAANAETRVISMYHVHTKERITVAYWKDGRFIPSGLKKLNWFLRDWRNNRIKRIDPRTIDLVWKLHEDLGSKEPVHIISGHRSAATNAMLRRIGRHVARRSRHITGQAIDFKFPDIPTSRIRYLALAYGIGGVGYYGHNGFIHVDTGSVRHWPRLPARKYAYVVRKYRSMIGKRYRRPGGFMIAYAKRKSIFRNGGKSKPVIVASARRAAAAKASAGGPLNLIGKLPAGARVASAPLPRPRPYQVLVQAAATMEIAPASAPATVTNFASSNSSRDQIGMIIANMAREERTTRQYPRVNRSGKGDLALDIISGKARGVPLIDPMRLASVRGAAGKGDNLAGRVYNSPEAMIRYNGAPVPMENAQDAVDPRLSAARASMLPLPTIRGHAKARHQKVNRSGKGDLLTLRPLASIRKAAALDDTLKVSPLSFR